MSKNKLPIIKIQRDPSVISKQELSIDSKKMKINDQNIDINLQDIQRESTAQDFMKKDTKGLIAI